MSIVQHEFTNNILDILNNYFPDLENIILSDSDAISSH